ncbi:hypothetical protein [Streptomyces sp. NPDC054866]
MTDPDSRGGDGRETGWRRPSGIPTGTHGGGDRLEDAVVGDRPGCAVAVTGRDTRWR